MDDAFENDGLRNVRFDEFLNLNEAHRRALSDELRQVCDVGRKRKRTAESLRKFELTLGLVIANALAAQADPRGPAVYYSRARSTYSAHGAYNPDWLTYRILTGVIDGLRRAEIISGVVSKATGYGDAPRSTFQATPKLLETLAEHVIRPEDLVRDDDVAPVLILKGPGPKGAKPWLNYNRRAPEIILLDQPVRAYNAFLRDQPLAWTPPANAIEDLRQRMDEQGMRREMPDPAQRRLRRIYNEGRWDRGGRFYGGWWEQVPADLRQFITIDQQRTVELDFGGFLPRALYHREGINFDGDAYDIPEIREACVRRKMDWRGVVRPSIKRMFAVILNSQSPKGRHRVSDITLPNRMSTTRGYQLIEQHHHRIEKWFHKGVGLEIMNGESNICQRILTAAMAENIVVLSIHDSFRVQERHGDWLQQAMIEAYRDAFGFDPQVHRDR
jgi:hypothetical protein